MARGGPTIGGAWAEGYSRARENAIADTRYRLAEGLRIQRELRANEEAIARQRLEASRAQAVYAQSQAELDLLRRREAEIQTSPGKSYKADPYLADKMLEAERNVEASKQDVETQHRNMMEIVYQRNQAIEQKALPSRGGVPITGWGAHEATPGELWAEGKAAQAEKRLGGRGTTEFGEKLIETADRERAEDPEFEKQMAKERAGLEKEERYGEQQQTTLEGLQRRQELGHEQQQQENEDERLKLIFPLEEKAEAQRARGLEAQGSIEAAAAEIAARQRENQFIQSQQVPSGGGQGTGLLGLLGSLINKAGGGPGGGTMGSPGGSGGGAFGGKAGAAPRPQAPPGAAQRMQSGQGGAPTPPQRPMTPMFGQAGAPTPPVRPPGIGAARQELSPSKFAPPGYQGAAGQAAQNIPTPPVRPPGLGAAPQAAQNIPTPPPRPPGIGAAPQGISQAPGGPAPGAATPGAYGQGPPRPGGAGSVALGGAQTYPNLRPQGPQQPPQVPTVKEAIGAAAQHPIMNLPLDQIPAALTQMMFGGGGQGRPDLAYPQGPYPGGPRPQGPPGPPGDNRNILGAILPLQRAQQRPQGPYGALVAPTEPPQGPYGSLMATAAPPSISPRQFAPSGGVSMPGQAPQGPYGALTPQQAPQFPQQAQVPQQAPGFHPIRGEVGDFPPSYRAAIGGGAVSPYQPMPPPAPRPQPPAPQAGAAGGGVSQQARQAIANIESRGSGDYRAINKKSGAVGRYQIMPANVPSWTKQALGRAMTPQQLAASPQAQDAVFNHIFGGYMQKYGARGAAIKWNTGKAPQERPPSAAGLAYARKFEREGGLGGHGRAAGFHGISGEASDIPGIGGAADRASGAGRALTPEALAAPLPLRSAATNVRQLNPGLLSAVTSGANRFMADNPGYKVRVNEGFNTQGHTKFSHHHNGTAMDIQVIGPDGKDIPNRGNDPTGIYRKLASSVYGSAPAGVKEKLGWGGAFETSPGSGTQDLMHFDLGGDRGNLAPNFRLAALGGGEGGATPATMAGGETPSATTETSETGADRQQARQQQAYQPPPPPEMPEEPPHQQQAPWQPQQPIAAAPGRQKPQIGPPTVHDEREIAGMKPGSIFRTPDGRLKVVPIQPLQRPQQASYAGQ